MTKNGKLFELNFTYRNARQAVQEALGNATTERGLNRVGKFLSVQVCPACHGTRLSDAVRATLVADINLAEATAKTLDDVLTWAPTVIPTLPPSMTRMAESIVDELLVNARRLIDLGLGYLSLDRTSSTLSTGERQRIQLARAVRNRTTGWPVSHPYCTIWFATSTGAILAGTDLRGTDLSASRGLTGEQLTEARTDSATIAAIAE